MICTFPSNELSVPQPSGEITADVETGVVDAVGVGDASGVLVAVGVPVGVSGRAVCVGSLGVVVAVHVAVGVPGALVDVGVAVSALTS